VLDLAFTGTAINPEKVVNIVVTGGAGMVGTMSVVNLDQAQVDAVSRDLKDDGLLKAENIGPSQNASLLGP
jgi:nucleoside-diphosphate-sugar epimerase